MNVSALFPLVPVVAYVPILVTPALARPWQRRTLLFIAFLLAAIVWSLADVFLRSDLFFGHKKFFFDGIIVAFSLMAVQFHVFISSFFEPNRGRWLPFAYISLAGIVALVIAGVVPRGVEVDGSRLYLDYGPGIALLSLPLLGLRVRNFYVFRQRLKVLTDPVVRNQILSLTIALSILIGLTMLSVYLPFGKEYPISHFGNLLNAFILSYAVLRHNLIDIRLFLRRGAAWVTFAITGVIVYWLIVSFFHALMPFSLDFTTLYVATAVAVIVVGLLFQVRSSFFDLVTRPLQGPRYEIRRRLGEFTEKIHNVFSLKEQGSELLSL